MNYSYTHLTDYERYHIFILRKSKISLSEIARKLGRDKSTISREIQRNTGKRGYRPKQANHLAQGRKRKGNQQITDFGFAYISYLIENDWSPEQIHGRLKLMGWIDVPSIERIYLFIYADKANGGKLYQHLRCQKQRRKRYGSGQQRRGQIVDRRDIDERPAVVDKRSRFGDFEGDTIVGKQHKGALLTLVERKTRLCIIRPHQNRRASTIASSSIEALRPFKARTVTYDNGKEFANHKDIANALHIDVYFAKPYASWQRGSNENMNGLIRQYLPKSQRLDTVTLEQTQFIEHRLNNRPRKVLDYQTPLEVLSRC
ncbi:IS30 family transposase [Ostreibacterium oceani]|uniref:IS30 family transposase n=1 Tax=Ostreibacterium oceani TaxID=2654998 RepID=A0A6N7EWW9_9GAMM|nr:IS30 family transposase [Ostreibacterium oceani]MPV87012.1 IS30 family transposase [Ostreibacterium oceani]